MLAERFTAQLVAGAPARDPVAVAERLLAIQGQDQRGARLAVRTRTRGVTAADVDRALTDDRSLLITWLNRGTLHLVRGEDYPWLHTLTTPPLFTAVARRLHQEGVSPRQADRGVEVIEHALAQDGPLSRSALAERLTRARVPTEGQALVHVLLLSTVRGLTVRGPMVGGDQAYVLVRDWLPRAPPVDRDAALAELGRRYLAGHAPADARDLARWAGLPLRDARAALAAIAPELTERSDGLLQLRRHGRRRAARPPVARLLGAYDPVLLGWTSREPILGDHQGVVTVNGLFRPFVLVDGRAGGLWRLNDGHVVIEPFAPLSDAQSAALDEDALDVRRFLGLR